MIDKILLFTKFACIIFLMLSLSSCSCIVESNSCAVYKIKWKDLYYNSCSVSVEDFWCESVLITQNVDKETFQVIDKYANVNDYPLYAKDKNAMFFGRNIILDADPGTYEFIDENYWKDKNHVFYQGKVIEGADPNEFKIWDMTENSNKFNYITHDSKDYYLKWVPLWVDVDTFVIFTWKALEDHIVHAKDKGYYYLINEDRSFDYYPIEKIIRKFTISDIDSLEVLGGWYAKDNSNVYYYWENILDADVSTFKYLWNKFAVDVNYVYVEGERASHIDPTSFYVSTQKWVRWVDKNWCYSNYKWTKLAKCDIK